MGECITDFSTKSAREKPRKVRSGWPQARAGIEVGSVRRLGKGTDATVDADPFYGQLDRRLVFAPIRQLPYNFEAGTGAVVMDGYSAVISGSKTDRFVAYFQQNEKCQHRRTPQ
jgi:hypothetical protein